LKDQIPIFVHFVSWLKADDQTGDPQAAWRCAELHTPADSPLNGMKDILNR
jgi:hypothetical protein